MCVWMCEGEIDRERESTHQTTAWGSYPQSLQALLQVSGPWFSAKCAESQTAAS